MTIFIYNIYSTLVVFAFNETVSVLPFHNSSDFIANGCHYVPYRRHQTHTEDVFAFGQSFQWGSTVQKNLTSHLRYTLQYFVACSQLNPSLKSPEGGIEISRRQSLHIDMFNLNIIFKKYRHFSLIQNVSLCKLIFWGFFSGESFSSPNRPTNNLKKEGERQKKITCWTKKANTARFQLEGHPLVWLRHFLTDFNLRPTFDTDLFEKFCMI